jgi:hypothetical protein
MGINTLFVNLFILFISTVSMADSAPPYELNCHEKTMADYSYHMDVLMNKYDTVKITSTEFEKFRENLILRKEQHLDLCDEEQFALENTKQEQQNGVSAARGRQLASVSQGRVPASIHQGVDEQYLGGPTGSQEQIHSHPKRPLVRHGAYIELRNETDEEECPYEQSEDTLYDRVSIDF